MPNELHNKWSNIPPELEDLRDYLNDILEWIDLNAQEGDYALIQGDYGATLLLSTIAWPKELFLFIQQLTELCERKK